MNALGKIFARKNRRESLRVLAAACAPNVSILFIYWMLVRTGIYDAYPFLDNPLHVFSGAGIAWAFLSCWRLGIRHRALPKLPYWSATLFAAGVAAIVGILWEQYEFIWDLYRNWNLSPNIADFVKDLTNDLLGSFVFAVFAARRLLGPARGGKKRS